ncbi:MAG: MFS transporter [Candidatus Sericytochromatia bacterium]|nr:MFS transporter [Candidatus Sericytochromatia bacterium]
MPAAFAVFQNRHYFRYWLALLVSNLGSWMQSAALGWLTLQLSASAEALGWVVALRFLPSLLFSLPAGSLADTFSRRQIVRLAQMLMMLLSLWMAIWVWQDRVVFWHLLLFSFAQGTLTALDLPARQALVVELVSRQNYPKALSLNSFTFNLSRLFGPALAGLAIAAWGMAWAFGVNVLTFVPLIVVLWRLPVAFQQKPLRTGRFWSGFTFVWREPLVRSLFLILAWISIFGVNFSTLIPAYARLEMGLEVQGYGFLMSAFGLGALGGSLWQIWSAGARPRRLWWAGLWLAALHLLLAFKVPVWGVALLWAACGAAMVTLLLNTNTCVQTLVSDALRGRVMAAYSMVLMGTAPLGAWLTGWLFDLLGGRPTLAILGGLTLLGLLPFMRQTLPVILEPEQVGEPSAKDQMLTAATVSASGKGLSSRQQAGSGTKSSPYSP